MLKVISTKALKLFVKYKALHACILLLTVVSIVISCNRLASNSKSSLLGYTVAPENSLDSSLYPLTDREREFEEITSIDRKRYDFSDEEIEKMTPKQKNYLDSLLQSLVRYELNRSRWNLRHRSTIELYEKIPDIEFIENPCSCRLKGDTVEVFTGLWLFGGQFVSLNISRKGFEGIFIDDTDGYEQFYLLSSDTIDLAKIEVPIIDAKLILAEPFVAKPGQQMTGELLFSTEDYYSRYQYQRDSNGRRIEGLNSSQAATGSIVFTCQVLEK